MQQLVLLVILCSQLQLEYTILSDSLDTSKPEKLSSYRYKNTENTRLPGYTTCPIIHWRGKTLIIFLSQSSFFHS